MIQKFTSWIKNNKLSTILIVVLAYFVLNNTNSPILYSKNRILSESFGSTGSMMLGASPMMDSADMYYEPEIAPQNNVTTRKVITKSNLSLLVKDVEQSVESIKSYVANTNGYVVTTNVTKPEYGANGYLSIRIPAAQLDQTLEFLKSISIKVVSVNISGNDITDQYEDISEKLRQLQTTKTRFEQIMTQAQDVTEILKVQREILNLQTQIDSLKGRQAYLDGASETTLISINLSTDELGLPYAPAQPWRPEVIFKQAVRSLIGHVQDLGSAAIWLVVYAPVLLLALLIILAIKKTFKKMNP